MKMSTETAEVLTLFSTVAATTDMPLPWHQINWRQAERNVRRLQARIAQATQAGKWGRVKALQRLLTHSLSGKALAVRRVTENTDRKSTRLNSSHTVISYAVFCLKKKNKLYEDLR